MGGCAVRGCAGGGCIPSVHSVDLSIPFRESERCSVRCVPLAPPRSGSVVVWSTHVFLDVFWSEKCHKCEVTAVTVFQETFALSGGSDGSVQIYNIDPNWDPDSSDAELGPAAEYEISGSREGRLLSKIEGDGCSVTSAACLPQMHLTIITNEAGRIFVYELDSGRCVGALVPSAKKQDGFLKARCSF